ncbi:MAG TPA: ABC transporter permease [Gaiella sp.]|nr:ABC transporter permease [Gaiella sp.]
MSAVFGLTVRQLVGSRRIWLVLALVALPLLAAALYRVGDSETTSERFADNVTTTLLASAILPLAMLLFATSAFGNELVDRTLGYLTLKPIARWRIIVPKLAAALIVGGIPVALSGFAAVAVADGRLGGALATGLGLLVGAAAYAAIFTWAGLATRHALLIGLVYVFVWEATLAAYLDGVRFLSVRRYTLSLIHALDADRLTRIDDPLSAGVALMAAALVVGGVTLLAVRKRRRMDIP